MADSKLRAKVAQIARDHPETRAQLLPLLRQTASAGDEFLGGRTWGDPSPDRAVDDNVPYHKHKQSPPAGEDGSEQRKRYNQWYRKNVCPEHRTNCGAPWLAK